MTLRLGDTLIAGSGANQDLSNLTSQGKNIANWSSNVTNCITEIPQDIKLELNNGTLTLKAGSKVYVPNGVGVFDVVTISSDLTASTSGTASKLLFYNRTTNALDHWNTGDCKSGTSWSGVEGVFYNTSTNTIKYTVNSGSTWNAEYSLPIGIATTDGGFTSIDQVFNGFGYIGSTVFALPGVKGLVPNGRNADGSLKNIEFTTSSVLTETQSWNYDWTVCTLYKSNDTIFIAAYGDKDLTFDENKNLFFFNGGVVTVCPFTKYRMQNGISNFTPKTAFHALDYNDSSTIAGWAMPSSRYIDLTLGASGSTYTAPANGWVVLAKTANSDKGWVDISTSSGTVKFNIATFSGFEIAFTIPVHKSESFAINYDGMRVETNRFRFIYAEGEN